MLFCSFSNLTFALIAFALSICFFYVKYVYTYWQRRGVPYLKPSFPFGNFGKNFMQKISLVEQIDEIYRSTSEPFVGVYALFRPTLIIRDTNLIRTMLAKDFQHFMDRGVYCDEKNDPLSGHLFSLAADKWKYLRSKLTPAFSTGKIRAIFSTLLDCGRPLQKYVSQAAEAHQVVEAREMISCFMTDVIASVAFGIDIDSFADPNTPFRASGRKFFALTVRNGLRFICLAMSPFLVKWTGLRSMDRDDEEFYMNITQQTLELREHKNIVRKDFFQMLVQLRNSGNVQFDDNNWQTEIASNDKKTFTLEELAAQVFVFFVAGYETSASTLTFCLFEIARNPDIQQKVHEEIDRVLAQHDGELTYDSINELNYVQCCMDEAIRKHPPVSFLNRVCTKEYKIPGSNVTVEKGTAILIPSFSLHRDETFYPDPAIFDPSRFFSENRTGKSMNEMPYLPFGDGPRNCIGLRLGRISTVVGLALILQHHCIDIDDQHIGKELEYSKGSFILTPATGVYLKLKARRKTE